MEEEATTAGITCGRTLAPQTTADNHLASLHDDLSLCHTPKPTAMLIFDLQVTGPNNQQIYRSKAESQGTFSTAAVMAGRYTYCFDNDASSSSTKTISFNVHGIMFLGDDEPIAPVEQEIRELSANIQMVKDEQSYLVVRERVHRNTCESTVSTSGGAQGEECRGSGVGVVVCRMKEVGAAIRV